MHARLSKIKTREQQHWENRTVSGRKTRGATNSSTFGQRYRRCFTCVRAYVPLQQPRPGEALAAIVALAALIVGPHMHAEGGHADVDLVAVRAPSGLLIAQRPVRLSVSSQIWRGRVLLAAVRTLVVLVVLIRFGVRGGRPSTLGTRRWHGYRRRVDTEPGNDRYLRQSRFLLRAGGMSRRETNSQGGVLLATTFQDLPLGLDPFEEEPRPLAQNLILAARRLCHRSRHQCSVLFRMLCDSGRHWSLIDDITVMDQSASRCRQAHLRQFRQVVQLFGALGRRLAAALAGAIGSWLTAAVIGQPRASLGTEI